MVTIDYDARQWIASRHPGEPPVLMLVKKTYQTCCTTKTLDVVEVIPPGSGTDLRGLVRLTGDRDPVQVYTSPASATRYRRAKIIVQGWGSYQALGIKIQY